jgi:hypothetical protein
MTRAIRIEGDIAIVPLTQGYEAVIDATDVPLIDGKNWHSYIAKSFRYAVTNVAGEDGVRRHLRMHTAITGFPMTDHRDGDGLNNRRSNLRDVTFVENNQNARKRADNTSGYKGVTWNNRLGKWHAAIRAHNVRHHLGYFDTPEAAHAAYANASARLHGEFGRVA